MYLLLPRWDRGETARYGGKHTASSSPWGSPETKGGRSMVQSPLTGRVLPIISQPLTRPHLFSRSAQGTENQLLTPGPWEDMTDPKDSNTDILSFTQAGSGGTCVWSWWSPAPSFWTCNKAEHHGAGPGETQLTVRGGQEEARNKVSLPKPCSQRPTSSSEALPPQVSMISQNSSTSWGPSL